MCTKCSEAVIFQTVCVTNWPRIYFYFFYQSVLALSQPNPYFNLAVMPVLCCRWRLYAFKCVCQPQKQSKQKKQLKCAHDAQEPVMYVLAHSWASLFNVTDAYFCNDHSFIYHIIIHYYGLRLAPDFDWQTGIPTAQASCFLIILFCLMYI